MKRLRELFESIVYAGLKPASGSAKPESKNWLGPLKGRLNRFLDGSASSDPLHLTNRTTGQRVRTAVLIALPVALLLGGVGMAAMGVFDSASQLPAPERALKPSEVASKILPNLKTDLQAYTNREVQVLDVVVADGKISGSVKNSTGRAMTDAEVDFDLTDARGSRVGAVNCRIPHIDANGSAPFQMNIPQADAVYALVREVRNQ